MERSIIRKVSTPKGVRWEIFMPDGSVKQFRSPSEANEFADGLLFVEALTETTMDNLDGVEER